MTRLTLQGVPMILTRVAVPFLMLGAAASAQTVQVALSAPNQLVATTSLGGLSSATLGPIGALPPNSVVASSLGNGAATANLVWQASAAPGASLDADIQLRITMQAVVTPVGGINAAANVPVSEFLMTLQSAAPRQVRVSMERELWLTTGVVAPFLQVDVLDDGFIDFDGALTTNASNLVDLGTSPIPIRVRIGGGVSSTTDFAALFTGVVLNVRPENQVSTFRFYTGCGGTLVAEPSFATGGLTFQGQSVLGDFMVLAVGFGLQPVVTPSVGTAPVPCVFFPTPDLLFVLQAPPFTLVPAQLPLPAAVRPVTFYAQALTLGLQGITASDAYLVSAW
jgi:hypothetical protein